MRFGNWRLIVVRIKGDKGFSRCGHGHAIALDRIGGGWWHTDDWSECKR